MTRRAPAVVALAAAIAGVCATTAHGGNLSVSVHPAVISTVLGRKFVVRSSIGNRGSAPLTGLVAHLNVLSLQPGVYVDPEDWSSRRTRYLAPIPPGGSTEVTWRLQAVNSGSFGVYIAVLPRSGVPRPPITGPTVHVSIAHRRTIASGGALPLALGIPALLGGLSVGVRARRRAG